MVITDESISVTQILGVLVIVIGNSDSRFLQRPQKRSRGNQLIRRRLSNTKSIVSGSDPESQTSRQAGRHADRQTDRQTVKRLWWMVFETGKDVGIVGIR